MSKDKLYLMNLNHNKNSLNDDVSCVILEHNISRSLSILDTGDVHVAMVLINGHVDNIDCEIVGFIYCCLLDEKS